MQIFNFCEFKVAAKCTDRNTYLRNRFANMWENGLDCRGLTDRGLPILQRNCQEFRLSQQNTVFFSQKNLFALVLSLNGSKVCGVGT